MPRAMIRFRTRPIDEILPMTKAKISRRKVLVAGVFVGNHPLRLVPELLLYFVA